MEKFPYNVFGKKKDSMSSPTMVFVAGFPDDEMSAFSRLIAEFGETHRIVSVSWPGLDRKTVLNGRQGIDAGWGFAFPRLPQMLLNTIEEAVPKTSVAKYTLVGHDWGAYLCSMFENQFPERINKLVLLDVGVFADTGTQPFYELFVQMFYQGYFAMSFFSYKLFGEFMGTLVLKSFFVIARLCPFLCPTRRGDRYPRPLKEVHVSMTWPYFSFYRGFLSNFFSMPMFPSTPLLFMYGKRKNIMFHTRGVIRRCDETVGCRAIGFECGHWVQHEKSNEVVTAIRNFLS